MGDTPITDNVQRILRDAASDYSVGTDLALEDAQNGARYALLRLRSLVGLTEQDREQLGELARLVFEDEESAEVRELANQVKTREAASPLAIVIADIVLNSGSKTGRKQAMLGATFGAYAALRSRSVEYACIGAIAGAIAVSIRDLDRIPLGEGLP
jgi:hypothetical protein